MTTATDTTLVWRAATTTENYNWIKKISDALTAVGCVLTSDTGQINLSGSTVTIPSSPDDTFKQAGFQIRKLEASGKPTIYIRIDYGVRRYNSFSTAANNVVPCIRISVGTGTNGAGVLDGVQFTTYKAYSDWGYYWPSELPGAGQRPLFFSSDGQNYLTMVIDPALAGGSASYRAGSSVPLVFALERSVTPETGAYDSDGFVMCNVTGSVPTGEAGAAFYSVANLPGAASFQSPSYSIPAQNPGLFTSSFSAGSTNLFPVTVCLPKPKGPMKAVLYYYRLDIADGYTFSTTIYGETRTYIASGSLQAASAALAGSSVSPALRYD